MSEACTLVCKICGGEFVLPAGKLLFPCPACGTPHSRPRATGSTLADLRRAHQQRAACDFTNAAANYQRVLNAHPDEAEALWGLALCRYGVEYVRDEKSGERLPVVHFLNRRPFTEDPDYTLALARASADARPRYAQDAAYIARIQQEVLAAEQRGDTWDVFLCYKASVPGSPDAHTRELTHAQELYVALRDAGYSVFFAHTTLRRVAGANYEAQIFHALQSARVMLVITSEPAYLHTPWVHSEWSRYLERIDAHEDCRLIPLLYDGCDPYALPDAFLRRSLQGLPMGSLTALDDLRRILDERLKRTEQTAASPAAAPAAPGVEPLLRRIDIFLEDGDWDSADAYCEKVLDIDPECARAYVGKLMAALHARTRAALRDQSKPFDDHPHYKRALRFADQPLADELRGMIAHINERNARAAKEAAYKKAAAALASAKTDADFETTRKLFEAVDDFSDAREKIALCETKRLDWLYEQAADTMKHADSEQAFAEAQKQFEALGSHRDVAEKASQCAERAEVTRKDSIYIRAQGYCRTPLSEEKLLSAIQLYQSIPGWKDAEQQIEQCQREIEELRARDAAKLQERKRKEEAEQLARLKAKQKKKKRFLGVSTAALCLVVAVVLLVTQVIIPNSKYKAAVQLMESGQYEDAIVAFEALDGYKDSEAQIKNCNIAIKDRDYDIAMALMEAGQYEDAIVAFEALDGYKDSEAQILECRYRQAEYYAETGKINRAAITFGKLGRYKDARERSNALWDGIAERHTLSAGDDYTVGLRQDGTVVAVGDNDSGQCDVSGWNDIVAISASAYHTVGLRSDGTVVAVGSNDSGQCDVSGWNDIVAISAGDYYTVGLRSDGTVVAVGSNNYGQRDISGWSDIVSISAGNYHTVGLRSEGTIVAIGDNGDGQCDISGWSDIVSISAGLSYTVGLRSDGTVVAVGDNECGKCNVSSWSDIVSISAGGCQTVGLRADGTVVAVGNNSYGQCNISGWSDIVAISAGRIHNVVLRPDSTAVAVGSNYFGQCNVSGWRLKTIPRPTLPE